MIQDVWLTGHPYLRSLADFHAQIEASAAGIEIPSASIPNWAKYIGDFQSGIPLLHSPSAAIDLRPAEEVLVSLFEKLVSSPLPAKLAEQMGALNTQLRSDPDAARRAVAWLFNNDEFVHVHPGLLRYIGWTALVRFLSPVVSAFASWRNEENWLRRYCPTCGALPSMAQLVGTDPGRLRLLSCGCCRTRWRYRRTGCPFCEHEDDHRLAAVEIEGEAGLRIDYCETCGGYLKTYVGEGNESTLLADWTSLHLDIIARDRGLKRLAASLYQL